MADMQDPADTRIMGIVHSALRRDLCRARMVLEAGGLDPVRRRALGAHLVWMMDFLHRHHTAEDTGLYPAVRERNAAIGPLLDRMDGEHAAVHPAMDRLTAAARVLEQRDEAAAVLAAVIGLEEVLLPHLEHEERELMPIVDRTLSDAEWQELDRKHNLDTKSKRDLAFEGHWLIDGLDAESIGVVTALVPPVPRFVLVHLLGGPYRKRRRTLWAGTPAESVPSLRLAPSC